MKKNEQTNITKKIRTAMSNSRKDITFSISLFILLNIAVIFLAYLDPSTLIITIPFVFAPSLFALTTMPIVKENDNKEAKTYFAMFKTYFRIFFRGCYRLLIAFLFGYLAFMVVTGVGSFIATSTIIKEEFVEFTNSIAEITNVEEILNEYIDFLNSNEKVLYTFAVIICSGLIIATLTFLHKVAVGNVKVHFNLLTNNPLPCPVMNQIHRITIKKVHWKFFKDYYQALWFVPVVLLIGLLTGTACGMLFLDISIERCFIIGLFAALILFIPMAKYFIFSCRCIYEKYAMDYMQSFVNFSLEGLNKMKDNGRIDAENSDKIQSFIDKTQEEINKKKDNDNNL